MKYLMTKSLLESWQYTFDCFDGGEDDAREDFLRTLRREPCEPNEFMQNGIEFENMVYGTAHGDVDPTGHKWERGIRKLAQMIGDAPVQVRAQREIEVAGMTFLAYGVLDALKAGTIYDVKFSNKAFGSADLVGKYLNCTQHPMYFYLVPEAREFQYLVSDGEDIYVEAYRPEESPHIGNIISAFINNLKMDGLLDIYKEFWGAKE